mmetsp:Transcript_23919/g.38447  ORF Transcript_23919/g.38447 Transcript_23919/m.38447 type:complete len:271 (+) Transcript_23919:115-927(+)|eukprot:jgi/Bigna1/86826/estExt_fgenesh1_pg.C_140085
MKIYIVVTTIIISFCLISDLQQKEEHGHQSSKFKFLLGGGKQTKGGKRKKKSSTGVNLRPKGKEHIRFKAKKFKYSRTSGDLGARKSKHEEFPSKIESFKHGTKAQASTESASNFSMGLLDFDGFESDCDDVELRRIPGATSSDTRNWRNPHDQLDMLRCAAPVIDFLRKAGYKKAGAKTEARFIGEVRGCTNVSGYWDAAGLRETLPQGTRVTMLEVMRAVQNKTSLSFQQAYESVVGKHLVAAKAIERDYLLSMFQHEYSWFKTRAFI